MMSGAGADDVVEQVLTRMAELRIVPVLTMEDPGVAADVGAALAAGGLPIAEVTFRTPAAASVLAELARNPALIVGAGTVLTAEQVDVAVDAGASFVVSPGLNDEVLARARMRGVLALPGVATASEIHRAIRLGAGVVKLFPAGPLGGPAMVAALAAPFTGLKFVPTGGIGPGDAAGYLRLPSVLAVGGSWLATAGWIRDRRWVDITRAARQARLIAGR